MTLRLAFSTIVVLFVGCAEANYGDLGRTGGTGLSGTTGAGAATTGAGAGTTGAGTSTGAGAGTTGSGSGGAPGTSSSSGTGATGTSSGSSGTGGVPSGSSGGTGGDPYNTPPTCSSMTMALGGNDANMQPGVACKSCHVLFGKASGKTFDVGGTVYLTAHEPDECNGVNASGAVVVVTDANNAETQLPVNGVGNFYHHDLFGVAAFKGPIKVRVDYNGKSRKMIAPVTNGDCNACHTESGTMNAPGRIMLP